MVRRARQGRAAVATAPNLPHQRLHTPPGRATAPTTRRQPRQTHCGPPEVRRAPISTIYVIEDFDHWTPQDRTGAALLEQGFPAAPTFMLDVELWPQERQDKRQQMVRAFLDWLHAQGIERLDDIQQPSLVMVRVRCNGAQAEQILHHRDVRTADLPPRLGVAVQLLHTDSNQFPPIDPPSDDAPSIAVLDSGLTRGHSLLGAAVGDAQGYLAPHRSADDTDPHWHGTFVGGLALYGDVHGVIQQGQFVPQLRLFSGKVFEDDGQDQTEFVEKAVEEAVRELHAQYGSGSST